MTDGFHEDTMETSSSNRSELTVGGRRKRGRRRCRCCTCAQGSGHRGMGALQQPWELNFPRCGRAVSMQCNATGRGDVDPGDPCYAMPIASASLRATHAYRPPKAQCVSEQWWSLSQATTTTATGWISVQAPPGDSEPGNSTTTTRIPRQRQPRSHRLSDVGECEWSSTRFHSTHWRM
jgi:hypothetical protein